MEYCFSLNSIGPIDKKIWLSLKSIGPNCRLIRKQMNSQQRDECKRLIEYSGRLIINEFKHKTTLSGVRRTNSGYSIYRFCSKHSFCYSNWIVNIVSWKSFRRISSFIYLIWKFSKLKGHKQTGSDCVMQ